jgi:hypothetical protein
MKPFPIIKSCRDSCWKNDHWLSPKSVPWDVVIKHNQQAMINHGQSVNGLASRGGLSWRELACVLGDRTWNDYGERLGSELAAFHACCNMIIRELDDMTRGGDH